MIDPDAHLAQRDFRREELLADLPQHEWLEDPDLIGMDAINMPDVRTGRADNPYINLSSWFTLQAAQRAEAAHSQIDFSEIAAKRGVAPGLEGRIKDTLVESYIPGFNVMANLHQLIPAVATREGVPRQYWGDIARAPEGFGEVLASSNTKRQSLFMQTHQFMSVEDGLVPRLSPELFRVDDELGITTIADFDSVVE